MFHQSCEALRTSLLARIADLESENQRLVDKLLESHDAAAQRELELTDRLLAATNPLAARTVAAMRSQAPASPLPVMGRVGTSQAARRSGVRPVLNPAAAGFRPLTDMMNQQRQRVVDRVTTTFPPPAESESESESGLLEPRSDGHDPGQKSAAG